MIYRHFTEILLKITEEYGKISAKVEKSCPGNVSSIGGVCLFNGIAHH